MEQQGVPGRNGYRSATQAAAPEQERSVAAEYMYRRWLKGPVTRFDYEATRKVLMEELALLDGERILEIGCGPGTWTREVAPHAGTVLAVDISEEMVRHARQYTDGLPVEFLHSDILVADVQGVYDKVFSVRAVEWIPDRAGVVRKIAEALAPGGTIVLIVKTRFSIWRGRMRLIHWRQHRQPGGQGARAYLPSPGQLARAFAPHGIGPVRVRPVVMRLPVFRGGFYEYGIVPDPIAPLLLAPWRALHRVAGRPARSVAWAPLLLAESYAITLKHVAGRGLRTG